MSGGSPASPSTKSRAALASAKPRPISNQRGFEDAVDTYGDSITDAVPVTPTGDALRDLADQIARLAEATPARAAESSPSCWPPIPVREAAERWPGWWNAEIHGPPHRETDVALLCELHELLRSLRLLRRSGRRLLTTARGRRLLADPAALMLAIATGLLAGDDFRAACAELTVAVLLAGFEAEWSDPIARQVHPAIIVEGWQSLGEPPDLRAVSWAIADFIRPATAAGLIERQVDFPFHRRPLVLSAPGRSALIAALRARALAPRQGPY